MTDHQRLLPDGCVPVPMQLLVEAGPRKGRLTAYVVLHCVALTGEDFSVKRIARLCRMSVTDFRDAVAWLENNGWLRVDAVSGRANRYTPLTEKPESLIS